MPRSRQAALWSWGAWGRADRKQIVTFDVDKNLIEPWDEMQKQIHPFLRGELSRANSHPAFAFHANTRARIRRDHSFHLVSRLTIRSARKSSRRALPLTA